MIFFLWPIIIGGVFGLIMIVGTMLYSGKWALPSAERKAITRARVEAEVAEFKTTAAEHRARQDEIEARSRIAQMQLDAQLQAIHDANFQRALGEGGGNDPSAD